MGYQVVFCVALLILKVESDGGGGRGERRNDEDLAEIGLRFGNPIGGKLNENNWGGREIDRACNFIPGANGSYQLSTEEMVRMYGLPVETHTIETEDGYVLETHRIPAPGRHPVLLLYGLFMSSREMVLNCDRRALAIVLADQGFDVWMINYRGVGKSSGGGHRNRLRSRNTNWFWSFSCDEIGKFDIPANIDYILKLTGRRKVTWVGYSFGNSVMLAMLSLRPEYNGKVHLGFMMGATVSFTNLKHRPLQYISAYGGLIDAFIRTVHHGEMSLPGFLEAFVRRMLPYVCSAEIDRGGLGICGLSLLAADGYDPNQIDPRVIQALIGGLVNPVSSQVLAQWFQWIGTGKFTRMDRGPYRNTLAYGQTSAPEYPLGRITAPLVYFWAENDHLNTAEDVEISRRKLRSIRKVIKVSKASFNHVGFAFGKDADVYVYKQIVNILSESFQY